jgi:hypothetical protein
MNGIIWFIPKAAGVLRMSALKCFTHLLAPTVPSLAAWLLRKLQLQP